VLKNPKIGSPENTSKCRFGLNLELHARVLPMPWSCMARTRKRAVPRILFLEARHGPEFSVAAAEIGFFNTIGRERSLASLPEVDARPIRPQPDAAKSRSRGLSASGRLCPWIPDRKRRRPASPLEDTEAGRSGRDRPASAAAEPPRLCASTLRLALPGPTDPRHSRRTARGKGVDRVTMTRDRSGQA
jgi:hypothetical protein